MQIKRSNKSSNLAKLANVPERLQTRIFKCCIDTTMNCVVIQYGQYEVDTMNDLIDELIFGNYNQLNIDFIREGRFLIVKNNIVGEFVHMTYDLDNVHIQF